MPRYTASIRIGVEHNTEDLTRGFSRIDRNLDEAMLEATHQSALRLVGAIRSRIPYANPDPLGRDPKDYDHARDKWEHFVEPTPHGGRAIVSADDPVAYWYWSGTRRHKIPLLPKPVGTSLRFFWRGHVRHFRQVTHPGTTPHPYVEEGGAAAEPRMRSAFEEQVDEVFRGEDLRA